MSDSSNILASAVQEPGNTTPILNAETLASIRTMAGTNAAEFLADIVTDFVTDAPKDIATILQAIADGDAKSLSHSAHRLRSGSTSLGADRLAELCQTLEMQGRAGIVPPLTDCQGHIQDTYEAAKDALLSVVAIEES